MTEYRRAYIPGATWFSTVNLAERKENRLLVDRVGDLRKAVRSVKARHPFVEPGKATGARIVAASLLGAFDTGLGGFHRACRIYPLEPGETRMGKAGCQLAPFKFSRIRRPWHLSRKLGT